tara:strand:- start:1983 stop:3149 length:1167 start_codon:yes stop_codon:yes gene_type:complete
MNLNRISLRFLFSEKKYSYTNISIYISSLTFSFAIAVSLVVTGMSRAYKNDVELSLQSIEPEIRVTSLTNEYMNQFHIDSIYSELNNLSIENPSIIYSKYREEYVMARSSNTSNAFTAYAIESDPSRFYRFVDSIGSNSDSYFFTGGSLLVKHKLSVNDEIALFNIAKIINEETLKATKLKIDGTYNSKIPVFDDNIVFLSKDRLEKIFDKKNLYSGILVNGINIKEVKYLREKFKNFPVIFTSWDEKHRNILFWLTIFMNPIALIVFFMIFLATIYQVFSNWLILHDKSNSLYQFKLMGVSNNKIKGIYLYISLSMLSISLILGYGISILFSYIQNKFNIIKLDPSIYILDQIKTDIHLLDFLQLSLFIIIFIAISVPISFRVKGSR